MRVEVKDLQKCIEVGKEAERFNTELDVQMKAIEEKYEKKTSNPLEYFDTMVSTMVLLGGILIGINIGNKTIGEIIIATSILSCIAFWVVDYCFYKKAEQNRIKKTEECWAISAQYIDTEQYEIAELLTENEIMGYGEIVDCDGDYAVDLYFKGKGTNEISSETVYVNCKSCNFYSEEYFDLDEMTLWVCDLQKQLSKEKEK